MWIYSAYNKIKWKKIKKYSVTSTTFIQFHMIKDVVGKEGGQVADPVWCDESPSV